MTKKLEKLKEINVIISEKLMELETRMFVENIHDINEIVLKEETPRLVGG